jgi:AAA domain
LRRCATNRIDVLMIDPFVSCHRVSENDNSAIERVAKSWSRVAEEANCSIMAAHHNRKTGGESATVDDGRGASALRDAARTARAINTMTTGEAENAEIAESERSYFFRADIGKANLTAPAERADWFGLESVELGNYEGDWDVGDSVGVVTAWNYPAARALKITEGVIRAAQDAIKAGGPWRADQRSRNEPWVGIAVAQALGLDLRNKVNCRIVARTVADWLRTGLLRRIDRQDSRRQTRSYVEVGETAAVDEPRRDRKDEKQQEEPGLFTFAAVK